ncbi:hypothetical protein KI387_021312, partial [Taxus chinensis]
MASPPPSAEQKHPENTAEPPNYENGSNLEHRVSPPPIQGETVTGTSVLRRPKERRTRLAGLALRCAEVVFSFLSFVIMASNNQGIPGMRFDDYEEYSYSLAIAVIAFVYVAAQLGRGIYDELFAHNLFPKIVFCYIDFVGDQVLAYLLISSSSSAASITNRLRDEGDTRFTDMAAAS